MSDNISKKFFMGEVPDETEETRKDGKSVVRQRGTIAMLEEWFSSNVTQNDTKPMQDMFATFRQVRKLRQKPAHAVKPDVFDQKFFHEQRELVIAAYTAIRTIRLLFAGHFLLRASDIKISEVLSKGKIWTQ